MKKIICLVLVLIAISCSRDDKSQYNPPTPSLIGKWYQKEMIVDGVVFPYDDHETCGKDYIEFYGLNQIRSIDVFDCEEEIDWMGSYINYGNDLIISDGSESKAVKIIELTFTSLVFEYDEDQDDNSVNEHYIEKFER